MPVVVGVCVSDPLTAFGPLQSPEAIQDAAFMLDHAIVLDCPIVMGDVAEIETVGGTGTGFTVTVAVPDLVESCTLVAVTIACIWDDTDAGGV